MKKIKVWMQRYLPSEILGTLTAIFGGTIVYFLTSNAFLTAFAGTWGENIGFYASMIVRDVMNSIRSHRSNQIRYGLRSFAKDLRNIIVEFGPSEMLDSFIIRPFMMYIFPVFLNNVALGIFVGKLAADITFYIPTIIVYELRKKYQ